MGAPPAASRAGLIPESHLEARPSPSGLPALPGSAPRPGPATRSFSRSLWGSGLALPSPLSSTSVLETSPTRRRRPGPALYGRRDCRKLLWPQFSMLRRQRSLAAPPRQEARVQSLGKNARTKLEFPFRLVGFFLSFFLFLIARGEGGSGSLESPPWGVGS